MSGVQRGDRTQGMPRGGGLCMGGWVFAGFGEGVRVGRGREKGGGVVLHATRGKYRIFQEHHFAEKTLVTILQINFKTL